VHKIEALDQWCLQKLLGIKWYHHVQNDEVWRTTGQQQPPFGYCPSTAFSLFGHRCLRLAVHIPSGACQKEDSSYR